MAFRVISIKNRCKLEYCLNYLVCKSDDCKKILLDEIELIIIDTQQVSITSSLLVELSKKKIKILFCDEKHRPQFEICSYQNNSLSYKKIKEQINWNENIKNKLWQEIIKNKIFNSYRLLCVKEYYEQANLLKAYCDEVLEGDVSSREGHAAKVYFNTLFGNDFVRSDESNFINALLNYGYSILASFISREIKCLGYLTEIGIHHIGETNPFNLTYDFVEPLRALVDSFVVLNKVNEDNYRKIFPALLETKVKFKNNEMYLDNAIHLYIQSIFACLNENSLSKIGFIHYEF